MEIARDVLRLKGTPVDPDEFLGRWGPRRQFHGVHVFTCRLQSAQVEAYSKSDGIMSLKND